MVETKRTKQAAALSTTAAKRELDRLALTSRFSLTARILIVNVLPLVLLGGGLFYLDTYRGDDYVLIRLDPTRLEVVSPSRGIAADPMAWKAAAISLGTP